MFLQLKFRHAQMSQTGSDKSDKSDERADTGYLTPDI